MRLVPIALFLLLAADAQAQDTGAIHTPTVGGLAEGVSTYEVADGTKIEITWSKGRKDGPYRHLHPSGVLLEEGNYEEGQRSGQWVRRDAEGRKTASGRYLLGVPHGLHERYEYSEGKPGPVESVHYVLGLRHGAAILRESGGELVSGTFVRDLRHGVFASLDGKSGFRKLYFCGWQVPPQGGFPKRGDCKDRLALELHDASGLLAQPKPGKDAKLLTRALCEGSQKLGISVTIDDQGLPCGDAELPQQDANLAAAVMEAYSADDIVRAIDEQFDHYETVWGTFWQSTRTWKKRKTAFESSGYFKIFPDRRTEWIYFKSPCNVVVDPGAGEVEAATKAEPRKKATKRLADSPLRVLTAFADTKRRLLDDYTATVARRGDQMVVHLTPRAPQDDLASLQISLGFHDDELAVTGVTLNFRNRDMLATQFRSLFGALDRETDPYRLSQPRRMDSTWTKATTVDAADLPCSNQIW